MEPEDGGYATTDGELDSDNEDDVELDLKMWLKQLDAPETVTKVSPAARKPSAGNVSTASSRASNVERQSDVDFDSILGELNSLNEQLGDFGQPRESESSSHTVASKSVPAPKPINAQSKPARPLPPKKSKLGDDEFGDINSQLMGAIFELNKLVDESEGTKKKDVLEQTVPQRTSLAPDAGQQRISGHSNDGSDAAHRREKHSVESIAKHPVKKLPVESLQLDPVPQRSASAGRNFMKEEAAGREDTISVKSSDSRSSANSQTQSGCSIQSSGRSAASENLPQVCVKVFSPDGSSKSVLVDDCTTVGHLCEILIQKNLADRNRTWGITEQMPELFMQRLLEDHQFVSEEIRAWPKQTENRLMFLETPKKYEIFDKSRILDEETWSPTDLEGWLHMKSDGKKAWKKWNFVIRNGGIFYNAKGKGKDLTCLRSLSEVEIYTGVAWKKKFKAPTEFGIALKPALLQKKSAEDIKYLCADDSGMMWKWVTAIRLAKYGFQLYRNFRQSIWLPGTGSEPSTGRKLPGDDSENFNHKPPRPNGHQRASNLVDDSGVPSDVQSYSAGTLRRGSFDSTRSGSVCDAATGSKMVAQIPITAQTARLLSMQPSSAVKTLPRMNSQNHNEPRRPPLNGVYDQPVARDRETASTKRWMETSACLRSPSPDLPPPPPELLESPVTAFPTSPVPSTSGKSPSVRKPGPPAPPRRDQSTKLSFRDRSSGVVQTKNFILNLQRAIGQKHHHGAEGFGQLEMPLPPPPVYSDEPSYLDLGELPPPPAELLEELKVMRRRSKQPPATLAKHSTLKAMK